MTKPSSNATLQHTLKTLPNAPGIYRMLNAEGVVLYVGKALHLKKRVSSYFKSHGISIKTARLVEQIHSIEVTVTRNETEALLLEINLIKALQPKYNVLMRDDKSYPYIAVSTAHLFPRIYPVRFKKKKSSAKTPEVIYFGPYPNVTAVHEALDQVQKIFNIRNCSDSHFNHRSRPCLQYQIKRCSAPCTRFIAQEAYQTQVQQAMAFLSGKNTTIIEHLTTQMLAASTQLAFEEASHYRDQIKALRALQTPQGIISPQGNADVIALTTEDGHAMVQWAMVRNGDILSSETFFPKIPTTLEGAPLQEAMFEAFIAHHYLEYPDKIPSQLITKLTLTHKAALETLLTTAAGHTCHIQTHPRGLSARWYDFAWNNLQLALTHQQTTKGYWQARYEALEVALQLPIHRLECLDISHTQGHHTVASAVVFDLNGPCKSAYRRLTIDNITPGDDYAAMAKAVSKRLHSWEKAGYPALLILDGGKGQIAAVQTLFQQQQKKAPPILGIAKGPSRKAGLEQLYFVPSGETTEIALHLSPDDKALHLLQHIRDEAHRHAITTHRKKREKGGFHSTLEQLEGIGPKKRQALLQHFGGLRELSYATPDTIATVPGISPALAARIYAHFNA